MKKVNLLLMSLLLVGSNAWSSTVNLDFTAGVARWDNATVISGGDLVPSNWTQTPGLTPTDKWIPGTFASPPPTSIVVSSGGTDINLPIHFSGFEYNTGSAAASLGASVSGSCGTSEWNPPIASIQGESNCLFTNTLTTSALVSPYASIRPIFSITDADLTRFFDLQPKGIYRGSVSLSQFYKYYLGADISQFTDSQAFELVIDHTPTYLTSVTLTGDSAMATVYGSSTNDVSAKTSFDVTATGYFSNGINVSLKGSRGRDYELIGPSPAKIPYTIKCPECSNKLLVENGTVKNPSSKVSGADVNSINFKIDVEFGPVDLDPLTVGSYSDTFTLIFEPDV